MAHAEAEQPPLILTLTLDSLSQAFFDDMRRRHFPPARNVLAAHLTLFHKLPGDALDTIAGIVADHASRTPPLRLDVTGLRFLGYGSAYAIRSPQLSALHGDLARAFEPWLTPQDRQQFQPHVTIQNKAPAAEARRLFETLGDEFRPMTATGTGLSLWHYLGGPWRLAGTDAFAERPPVAADV